MSALDTVQHQPFGVLYTIKRGPIHSTVPFGGYASFGRRPLPHVTSIRSPGMSRRTSASNALSINDVAPFLSQKIKPSVIKGFFVRVNYSYLRFVKKQELLAS